MNSLISGLKTITDFKVIVYYNDLNYKNYIFEAPNFEWRYIQGNAGKLKKLNNGLSTVLGFSFPFVKWDMETHGTKPDILITQESLLGFYTKVPFIGFVGDIMYKYFPKLDEYSIKKRSLRDISTKRVIEKSVYTIVDSEYCKNDLVKFYDADPSKIIPIPLCAPPHVYAYQNMDDEEADRIIRKYGVPDSYLFYPAQYWEHKNHFRLIEALCFLKQKKEHKIPVVFVGSKKWEKYQKVVDFVNDHGLNDQVYFLGYVPDRNMVALYKRARAFIYASYGDYTGIPILEAMVLKTPVLSSNYFSLPVQVGDAGILFDPHDTNDIAGKILEIWDNTALRDKLIAAASRRAEELSPDKFSRKWISIIKQSLANG